MLDYMNVFGRNPEALNDWALRCAHENYGTELPQSRGELNNVIKRIGATVEGAT
jgi:hypothetical protein